MYKKLRPWEKHIDFIIIDLAVVILSYLASGIIRLGSLFFEKDDATFVVVLIVIYFIVSVLLSNYKNILRRTFWQEVRSVTIQFIASYGIFIVVLFLSKDTVQYSRLIYGVAALIGYIAVVIVRTLWKKMLNGRAMKSKRRMPKLYVIGTQDNVQKYLSAVLERKTRSVDICGAILCDAEVCAQETEINGIPVVCSFAEYKTFCLVNVVDEVFILCGNNALDLETADYFIELGVVVHVGLSVENSYDKLPNAWIEKKDGFAVYTSCYRTAGVWELVIKRLIDIIGGIFGVIFTLILYIFLAPRIKHADKGPALFKQKRVGRNGRIFNIYKFRSMYLDAEARKAELMALNEMGDSHMFKMDKDPRILPGVGEMIRRTSLDEFPQFINVLKGDMSLVGTRPPTLDEFKGYEPHHKARLAFKPGITGLWQTSGRSDIKDFEEIVRLDNEYIRNWSVWLDIKLLLKTVQVVLKKEGSR